MGFYEDVKPGEAFKPSASLSNDVRHMLNRLNGFGGGPITAGNPGVVRIPVYNTTSAVLSEGKAVSIDISGIIAGECYPAIAFSDEMPCYGVLAKDLNPAEVGDCILSGLAAVQIASTPATGNYATPGAGGVFTRGDEGVPIVNISGTAAVVMLGTIKTTGETPAPVSGGFPQFLYDEYAAAWSNQIELEKYYTVNQNAWLIGHVTASYDSSRSGVNKSNLFSLSMQSAPNASGSRRNYSFRLGSISSFYLDIRDQSGGFAVLSYGENIDIPICFPIPGNRKFYIRDVYDIATYVNLGVWGTNGTPAILTETDPY